MGSGTGVVPGWRLARGLRQRRDDRSGDRSARRARRPGVRESGVTLIETLISVAIMTTAVLAIAGAMGSSVRYSAVAQGSARAEAEARRIAEHLRSESFPYPECGTGVVNKYQAEIAAVKSAGFTADIPVDGSGTRQAFWTGNGDNWSVFGCSGRSATAHRITVEVVDTESGTKAQVTVVKRRPNG